MMKELQEEILRLKKETGAAILAHSYQSPEILEIADIRGDSFALSVAAQKREESTIVLCGVRFMADTVQAAEPREKGDSAGGPGGMSHGRPNPARAGTAL